MLILVTALLAFASPSNSQRFPSCDLKTQRALKGQVGGAVTDPRQAHVSMRADVLQADIGNARKARRLTSKDADLLYRQVDAVRKGSDRYIKQQGFLSAAEVASYDRMLDDAAAAVCGR